MAGLSPRLTGSTIDNPPNYDNAFKANPLLSFADPGQCNLSEIFVYAVRSLLL